MMTEDQAERIIAVLMEMAADLAALRSDFDEFRAYGTQNMDAVTGALGCSLTDVADRLDDIGGTLKLIDINTTP